MTSIDLHEPLPGASPVEILLVEDSATDTRTFRDALEAIHPDWDVSTVADAASAITHLAREARLPMPPPAAIFLDLQAPTLDGGTLLRWIHDQPFLERTPVFIVTGSVAHPARLDDGQGHKISLLPRPITSFGLASAILLE